MSLIGEITNDGEFENTENDADVLEGLHDYSLNEPLPLEGKNTFLLSHQNPELQSVMTNSEILNVSHNELSPSAFDASFLAAQNALVSHFELQLSGLPDDVRTSFLESLDLQSKYKPDFPLFAQMVKSSYA